MWGSLFLHPSPTTTTTNYLLRTSSVPGTALGTGDLVAKKTKSLSPRSIHDTLVEADDEPANAWHKRRQTAETGGRKASRILQAPPGPDFCVLCSQMQHQHPVGIF